LSQSYVQLQQAKYLNRYGVCMRDSELVASIVAGDPEGLAAAYDRYSGPLFGYCQSLLREPDDAADAVQDTFVIAASKLGRLRDPERLRAWLFTVARNECLHRLKSRRTAAPLDDIPEQPDESVDVGGEAERAESRALIRAAVGGLNDGERDVINQVWHGLEIPEVAMALGVSRNHAHSLFSRARDQLEASVGVLVVGRSGRKDCAALDQLLHGWDGRLTAPLRRRVGRHIDRCSVCSDRRRRELRPAVLLSVAPVALAPAGLRAKVLRLGTDHGRDTPRVRFSSTGSRTRSTPATSGWCGSRTCRWPRPAGRRWRPPRPWSCSRWCRRPTGRRQAADQRRRARPAGRRPRPPGAPALVPRRPAGCRPWARARTARWPDRHRPRPPAGRCAPPRRRAPRPARRRRRAGRRRPRRPRPRPRRPRPRRS
jgi:RNA polymerase sigma factor (sigma-70 family)